MKHAEIDFFSYLPSFIILAFELSVLNSFGRLSNDLKYYAEICQWLSLKQRSNISETFSLPIVRHMVK